MLVVAAPSSSRMQAAGRPSLVVPHHAARAPPYVPKEAAASIEYQLRVGNATPERARSLFHAPRRAYALVESVRNYADNTTRETRSLQKGMAPRAYTVGVRVHAAPNGGVVAYPSIAAACCASHLPAHANAGKRRVLELEMGPGVVRPTADGGLRASTALPTRFFPVPKAFWREARPQAPQWTPTCAPSWQP